MPSTTSPEPPTQPSALDLGGTATKLSRTPLGIIALFIVLVYAMASLVLATGRIPDQASVTPLIWFMVLFPVVVFGGFVWLVATRPRNLYGPGDFPDAKDYLTLVGLASVSEQERVPEAPAPALPPHGAEPQRPAESPEAITLERRDSQKGERVGAPVSLPNGPETPVVLGADVSTKEGRIEHRKALYDKTRKLFLMHVLTKSPKANQKYGIGLYVKHHEEKDLSDVKSAEFFLGKSWGNRIIQGTPSGNRIGISTSAFGPFLCTCLVTFTDGERVMLYRYVDFEMGPLVDAKG